MPRTGRVFVENACYHITARGNQKKPIFRNNGDFEAYLNLIHKYKVKFGCLLYGYCLMANHVHLIIESPFGMQAMSSFMHGLNQSYAMLFNSQYDKVGHLWQNRYKNFVVLKNYYMVSLISYVELNPVRAKIVDKPEDYMWSSYRSRNLGVKNIILDRIKT